MAEEPVTSLPLSLRHKFALAKGGELIPVIAPFISCILNHISKKKANGKFCLACFFEGMSKLNLSDNMDDNAIEEVKTQIFKNIEKVIYSVIIYYVKFLSHITRPSATRIIGDPHGKEARIF